MGRALEASIAVAGSRSEESPGLGRPGLFLAGKRFPLSKYQPDDGLPNNQMDKPKEIIRVSFFPKEKARKPVRFWAAKPALSSSFTYSSFCLE
jgi:hypothetical protein